jgi:hypothetical protein
MRISFLAFSYTAQAVSVTDRLKIWGAMLAWIGINYLLPNAY